MNLSNGMSSFDQEATEVDIIELNELKQSVASCQRTIGPD